jgi:arginase family enzyme
MSGIVSQNPIRFFGASLDALDHPEAVEIKRSYVHALAIGKCPQPDLRDPYALFRQVIVGDPTQESGHLNLGRFAIESWLTPKPQIADRDFIDQRSYRQFLQNDGFKYFAGLIKGFVKAHIFPSLPGMIGVDHSLTGGVLMALSERLGCENLGMIVFDVHTDAIPLPIRSGLVQYALEKGFPSPGPLSNSRSLDPYTAGNFLLHLIEQEVILPANLVLIGPADDADKWRKSRDGRVREYVRHYDSLGKRGVRIISGDRLKTSGPNTVQEALDQLNCSHLYVSLDVDVSAQCGVLAARFNDLAGTETDLVLEAVGRVAGSLSSKRFELAGLDVMEIDIHRIGAELEDGLKDQTENFVRTFVGLLVPDLLGQGPGSWTRGGKKFGDPN